MRQAARGDSSAFHALVDRHSDQLFRLARYLSGSQPDAEDLCQETLIDAFRSMHRFEGRSSVRTWLRRILLRRATRLWHRRRRKVLSIHEAEREAGELDGRLSLGSSEVRVDCQLDVAAVLQKLPPKLAQVFALREMEQMSYEEISRNLGIPAGTVESRLHRARAQLRGLLKGYMTEEE